MSLTLNEKEKRNIVAVVQDKLEAHLKHFPFARYPVEPLNEWQRMFCDPKTVSSDTLKKALSWHFGNWQRKGLALSHRKIISTILKFWPEYADQPAHDAEQTFLYWEQKLSDWHHGFGAVAFLLHLQRSDQIEIADRHRIDAMFNLLKAIDHADKERVSALSFLDLQDYTSFFRFIFPKLPYGTESRNKLDRFLKAYGNRHAYRNVAAEYRTREPAIREFSWEMASSKQFDIAKIKLRSNADVLFVCLLLSLEQRGQQDEQLTIEKIAEYIPLGTAGICNPASYNYAMISLFGCQKGRDYFQLESAALQESFTEQANQSTRDMKFYVKHAEKAVVINPKYIIKS